MQEKRSAAGLLVPLLMLGFAGIYWFENRGVPARDMRMVTPLTIILVILSVALAVRWLAGRDRDGGEPIDLAALRRPVGLLAATLVLLFGADYDFPLAAAAFLALALPLLGLRRPVAVVATAILLPLVLFVGFTQLGVPLTTFWLEF